MESKRTLVSLFVKRVVFSAVVLLIVGGIGGFAALTATNPQIPHPWGQIRHTQYSTNGTATLAHFRFRNLFEWPVFMEVGLELRTDHGWEMARGYSMFVPIEKTVGANDGQNFLVPMPVDCKAWRVLVRAAKAGPTETDLRRERIKHWLDSHGAGFMGGRIQVEDPNGYILPGPEMKYEKPGQLPTAHYDAYIGPITPIKNRKVTARTKCPR